MNVIDPPISGDTRETQIHERIGRAGLVVNAFSVNALPDPKLWSDNLTFSAIIYIFDESGGGVLANSDGVNWRRVTDREIVS